MSSTNIIYFLQIVKINIENRISQRWPGGSVVIRVSNVVDTHPHREEGVIRSPGRERRVAINKSSEFIRLVYKWQNFWIWLKSCHKRRVCGCSSGCKIEVERERGVICCRDGQAIDLLDTNLAWKIFLYLNKEKYKILHNCSLRMSSNPETAGSLRCCRLQRKGVLR